MREILFRGKRVDNSEWVQGDLLHGYFKNEDTCICSPNWTNIKQVVPETIGQFTGLTDKNGVKIFEGDYIGVTCIDDETERRIVLVSFGEFTDINGNGDIMLGYYLTFDGKTMSLLNGKDEGYGLADVCEVIGNIHDNPKLIGG